MMHRRSFHPALASCLVLAASAFDLADAHACGASDEPPWATDLRDAQSVQAFVDGRIGLLPEYAPTSILLIAFRHFEGVGLTTVEANGARVVLDERLGNRSGALVDASPAYLVVRARVESTSHPIERVGAYTADYEYVQHCLPDAFHHAAATLQARIARFGAISPEARAFVAGQDAVFDACDGRTETAFAPLSRSASATMLDDRRYHHAAQTFYLGRADAALAELGAIVGDATSAHRATAALVRARVLERRAALDPSVDAHAVRRECLALLESIARDPALVSARDAAASYARYVRRKDGDVEPFRSLAVPLTEQPMGSAFESAFRDLLFLDAQFDPAPTPMFGGTRFGAFVRTFGAPTPENLDEALREYEASHSAAFLVSALRALDRGYLPGPSRAKVDELVAAALALPDSHPAYTTARFHAARILLARGGTSVTAAHEALGPLRETTRYGREGYTRRAVLELTFLAARNVDDLIESMGNTDWYAAYGASEGPRFELHVFAIRDMFDALAVEDWISLVSRDTPTARDARGSVEDVAFARAIALGDDALAEALLPHMMERHPEAALALGVWRDAAPGVARRRARLTLLLAHPGIAFSLDTLSRFEPSDTYAGARSLCLSPEPSRAPDAPATRTVESVAEARIHDLLGDARIARGRVEHERLRALGAGATFLQREAADLAEAHPDPHHDPTLLADAIHAGRHACGDEASIRQARRAFHILHTRYEGTPEAARTRYFYGGR